MPGVDVDGFFKVQGLAALELAHQCFADVSVAVDKIITGVGGEKILQMSAVDILLDERERVIAM